MTTATSHCSWGERGAMQEVVCARWAGGWVLTAVLMNDGG
jgi:hypothetical protein